MVCLSCGTFDCGENNPICAVACIRKLMERVDRLERQITATNLFIHPVLNNTGKVFRYNGPRTFEQITSDGEGNFWALSSGSLYHCKITARSDYIEIEETPIPFSPLENEIVAFSTRDGDLAYALDSKGGIYGWSPNSKTFVLYERDWPYAISAKPKFEGKIRKMVTTTGGTDSRHGRQYILDEQALASYSLDFFHRLEVFRGEATDFFVQGADVYVPSGLINMCTPFSNSTDVFSIGEGSVRCLAIEKDVMIAGHDDHITLCRLADHTIVQRIDLDIRSAGELNSMLVNENGSLILHYGDNQLYLVV